MTNQAIAVDYCLLVESDPGDPGSDLLGVRRVYTALTYPTPGEDGTGEWRTFVDTIPRAGNSRGKVVMSVEYAGRPAVSELNLRANPLSDWLADAEAKHGGPPTLD